MLVDSHLRCWFAELLFDKFSAISWSTMLLSNILAANASGSMPFTESNSNKSGTMRGSTLGTRSVYSLTRPYVWSRKDGRAAGSRADAADAAADHNVDAAAQQGWDIRRDIKTVALECAAALGHPDAGSVGRNRRIGNVYGNGAGGIDSEDQQENNSRDGLEKKHWLLSLRDEKRPRPDYARISPR